ncbi:POLA2, partial [Symbiodinium microadriaticum]
MAESKIESVRYCLAVIVHRDNNGFALVQISPDVSLSKRPLPFGTPQGVKVARADDSPDSISSDFTQSQSQSGSFQSRENIGQVVAKLNESLPVRGSFRSSQSSLLGARCTVSLKDSDEFPNVMQRYRYMFTTLEERARALDRHHASLEEDMCSRAGIGDSLGAVGIPSPDPVWVCGRICNEASEGKINKTSVVLEGSRSGSSRRRAHLDLQELPQYALFPGQIVLVEGINASGRRMVAKRILEGVPRPLSQSPPSRLLEYHHSRLHQGGGALNVIVAAGPFTTTDNLDYEPLEELLRLVAEDKPDVLILIGPFVDSSQPLVAEGAATLYTRDDFGNVVYGSEHVASYEMIFVEKVIRIILVPSLLDAHHECVYPQPPFGDRDRVDTEFFVEPLGVLNVLFGITSADVLFSLSSDEVSANSGHRMT